MSRYRHIIDLEFPDDESPKVILDKFIEALELSAKEITTEDLTDLRKNGEQKANAIDLLDSIITEMQNWDTSTLHNIRNSARHQAEKLRQARKLMGGSK